MDIKQSDGCEWLTAQKKNKKELTEKIESKSLPPWSG